MSDRIMTIQNAAVVFVRLSALYTLLQGILRVFPAIAVSFLSDHHEILGVGVAAVILFTSFMLWHFAPWLGRKVSQGYDSKIEIVPLTVKNLYTLCFLAAGLYYFIGNLGTTLNWIHYFISAHPGDLSPEERTQNFYQTFEYGVPFILGLMAVLFCDRWAQFLIDRQDRRLESE